MKPVLILVSALKKGDRIRANEAGEIKEVASIQPARVSGYKVAVFADGNQKALGHKTSSVTIYV